MMSAATRNSGKWEDFGVRVHTLLQGRESSAATFLSFFSMAEEHGEYLVEKDIIVHYKYKISVLPVFLQRIKRSSHSAAFGAPKIYDDSLRPPSPWRHPHLEPDERRSR